MITNYVPILMIFGVGIAIALVMVVGSWLLGPRRPTPAKSAPYECGITPVGSAHERFPVHFYLVAILFVIFDVETIFFYPFLTTMRHLDPIVRPYVFGVMAVFTLPILVGFIYELRKGALEWEDPVEHRQRKVAAAEERRLRLQKMGAETPSHALANSENTN
jgi:NADH-quinone oxidoreductase subunit A